MRRPFDRETKKRAVELHLNEHIASTSFVQALGLKAELVYIHRIQSVSHLAQDVARYIRFYNHERYQKKLRDMASVEYRPHITRSA